MCAYVCEMTQCAAVRTQLRSRTTPLQMKPKELKSPTCHGDDTDDEGVDCPLTPHSDVPHTTRRHIGAEGRHYSTTSATGPIEMLAKVWDSGMKSSLESTLQTVREKIIMYKMKQSRLLAMDVAGGRGPIKRLH